MSTKESKNAKKNTILQKLGTQKLTEWEWQMVKFAA